MTVDQSENLVVGVLFILFFGGMFVPLIMGRLNRNKSEAPK